MHAHHKTLLAGIEKHRRKRPHPQSNDSYLSSGHFYYDVSIPNLRAVAKSWVKENKAIDDPQFAAVLDGLYRSKSYEEKVLASLVLSYHRAARASVGPKQLDAWLDHLAGWAEIDSLCAGALHRRRASR